jgi:hypothetical protein
VQCLGLTGQLCWTEAAPYRSALATRLHTHRTLVGPYALRYGRLPPYMRAYGPVNTSPRPVSASSGDVQVCVQTRHARKTFPTTQARPAVP